MSQDDDWFKRYGHIPKHALFPTYQLSKAEQEERDARWARLHDKIAKENAGHGQK